MSIHTRIGKERYRLNNRSLRLAKTGKRSAVMSVIRDVFLDIKHTATGLESQITSDEEGPCLSFDRTCESEISKKVDDGFKGFMSGGLVATPNGGMHLMVDVRRRWRHLRK